MTPMLVPTGDLVTRIQRITRRFTTPQFPVMSRSHQVLIPHMRFLKHEWMDSWSQHKAAMGWHENVNRATCDDIATGACSHFNRIVRKKAKMEGADFTGGMFVARIYINKTPFMGIVDATGHFNTWVAFTTNYEDFEVGLWEPQMDQFTFMPLEEACESVDLYDFDK
jgi:hypothetical protein